MEPTTLSFEDFWQWLLEHHNCILRAGTPETILGLAAQIERENLCHGAFADPFIQVVDDLGAAIVEHQLGGSAFRSTDGQSRCFAALERLFRPGAGLWAEPLVWSCSRGRGRMGRTDWEEAWRTWKACARPSPSGPSPADAPSGPDRKRKSQPLPKPRLLGGKIRQYRGVPQIEASELCQIQLEERRERPDRP